MTDVAPEPDTAPAPAADGRFSRLRFVKHSAVYGSSQFLIRGISVLLLPFYTRVLSPTDYGIMDLVGVAVAFLTTAVSFEVGQAVGRFYTEAEDPEERRSIASSALWFALAAYLAFALVPLLAGDWIAGWMLTGGHANVIRVAGCGLVLQGLFFLTIEQLRWQLKPDRHALVSVVSTLVLVGSTAVFLLALHTGVVGIFYGQIVGNAVGVSLATWFGREAYRLRVDLPRLRELLAFSIPLVPGAAAVTAAFLVDRIAVRALLDLRSLGLYAITYRFGTVISLLMIGINGAFMPLVLTHHREPTTPRAVADIFRYFVCLATLLFLGMSIFSGWFLRVLTTHRYYDAAAIVPLIVLAVSFSSMSLFAPGLVIAKRTRLLATVNLAGAAVNAAAVFALTAAFGLVGAAAGTAGAFAVTFAVLMAISQRFYRVPHAWARLLAGAGIADAVVAVYWFTVRVRPADEGAGSLLVELAIAAAAGAAVLATLVRRDELGTLKRLVLSR